MQKDFPPGWKTGAGQSWPHSEGRYLHLQGQPSPTDELWIHSKINLSTQQLILMRGNSICAYSTCQYEVSSGSVTFCWEEKILKGLLHLGVHKSQQVVGVVAMRLTNQTEGNSVIIHTMNKI